LASSSNEINTLPIQNQEGFLETKEYIKLLSPLPLSAGNHLYLVGNAKYPNALNFTGKVDYITPEKEFQHVGRSSIFREKEEKEKDVQVQRQHDRCIAGSQHGSRVS